MKRFFRNLKSLAMVAVIGFSTLAVSCYDDTELRDNIAANTEDIAELTARVEALEIRLGNEVSALEALIADEIAKVNDAIEAVEDKIVIASAEKNAEGEWILTLADGDTVTVYPEYKETNEGLLTVVKENGVYFWAQIVDGVAVKLTDELGNGYAVHHATVVPEIEIPEGHDAPQVRVNEAGFTEVSFDGGATWHQLGGGDTGLFQSVVVDGDSLTFTMNGGEVFTVTLPEEFNFEVAGNKKFFAAGETAEVAMSATAIKETAIIALPEGWKASINGNKLVVVAPAQEAIDGGNIEKTGAVKVLAVTGEGKAIIGKLTVSVEKGYTIEVKVAPVQTGYDPETYDPIYEEKMAVVVNHQMSTLLYDDYYDEYYEQPSQLFVGMFPKGEYTAEELAEELAAGWYGNYPYNYVQLYETGEYAYPLDEFFQDNYDMEVIPFEAGGEYVIFATCITTVGWNYSIDPADFVFVDYVHRSLDVTEVSTSPFDVQIKATVAGYPSYRVYFATAEYSWEDYWAECESWGDPFGFVRTDETFEGSLFDFGYDANGWDEKMTALPGVQYQLVLIPEIDGVYAKENAKVYYFSTTQATAGGSVVPAYTEGQKDYAKVTVTVDAPGAKLTYYSWYKEAAYAEFEGDEELLFESVSENGYIKAEESFTITNSGLKQGESIYLVAYSIDANGKYGALKVEKFTTKSVNFSETMTVTIDDFKMSALGTDVYYKISVAGNTSAIAQYRYANVSNEFTWNSTFGGSIEAAGGYMATVPSVYYSVVFLDPETGENEKTGAIEYISEGEYAGYYHISDLSVGATYNFVFIAIDENGEVSPAVGKTYTTEMNVGFVYADEEGYDTYKPTVTFDSITEGSYGDAYKDVKITVTLAEGVTAFMQIMDVEYEETYNQPFTMMQYLATNVSSYYSTKFTETGTYEKTNKYMGATSYLYITWCNPAGDTYYEALKLEIPGVTVVETPAE